MVALRSTFIEDAVTALILSDHALLMMSSFSWLVRTPHLIKTPQFICSLEIFSGWLGSALLWIDNTLVSIPINDKTILNNLFLIYFNIQAFTFERPWNRSASFLMNSHACCSSEDKRTLRVVVLRSRGCSPH